MTALFQTPLLNCSSEDFDEPFDFDNFVHGGDLDIVANSDSEELGTESDAILPILENSWCLPIEDTGNKAGDAIPTLHLTYSAADKSVDTPVQSESENYAELEAVSDPKSFTITEFETKCQNFRMKSQKETRAPHGGLYTKPSVFDKQELAASPPKALTRATELLGIGEAREATFRLHTILNATQLIRTEMQVRPKTASEPQGVGFPATLRGGVSDRDPGATSKKGLASPFQKVLYQPKQPRAVIDLTENNGSNTAVGPILATDQVVIPTPQAWKSHCMPDDRNPTSKKRKCDLSPAVPVPKYLRKLSIPGDEWLSNFGFSAYLNENPPDDTIFFFDSIPSILGDTWPKNLESPVYLKDNLAAAGDKLPRPDRHAVIAGPLQITPAVPTLGQIIDSEIDGISIVNNVTNFAYPNGTLSGPRRRAKKACDRCRRKKVRCNRKGEEECVPLGKAGKSGNRQVPRRQIQGSTAISRSLEPQVIQLEQPDLLAVHQSL